MERPGTMYTHTHEGRYISSSSPSAPSSPLAHAQSGSVNAPGGPAANPSVRRSVKKSALGTKLTLDAYGRVRTRRARRMYMHRLSRLAAEVRDLAIIAPRQSLIIIPDTLLSAPSYGIAAFCARPLFSGCYFTDAPFSSSSPSVARTRTSPCLTRASFRVSS